MTLGPEGEAGGEYLSKRGARAAARRELARQARLGFEAKPEGRRTLTEKGSIEALGRELKCGEDDWKVRT